MPTPQASAVTGAQASAIPTLQPFTVTCAGFEHKDPRPNPASIAQTPQPMPAELPFLENSHETASFVKPLHFYISRSPPFHNPHAPVSRLAHS